MAKSKLAALFAAALAWVTGFSAAVACPPGPDAGQGSISGRVSSNEGNPVRGAVITLRRGSLSQSVSSDALGKFAIQRIEPGLYTISAFSKNYAPLSERVVEICGARVVTLSLVLQVGQASSLTVLGRVEVNGGQTLSSASAPSVDINAPVYAARGITHASDMLGDLLSTTVVPVLGGGFNAPGVVALRGPDPSETLVEIDGHQVNNGNTGDYDLSLLDPADLSTVQVVYGIAPSSLVGPNTLGGAINIRTLEPTAQQHSLLRFTASSYDTFGQTLQTTGTDQHVGYALSYHRVTSGGELNDFQVTDSDGDQSRVGDGLDATSTLAKMRYTFGSSDGFVGLTFRDQAAYRDLSAVLTSLEPPSQDASPAYDSAAGSAIQSHNAAYGLDAQVPIGKPDSGGATPWSALFRHLTSVVSQSVQGPATGSSPYLFSGRDLIGDDSLQFTRILDRDSLSLKLALTQEDLATDFVSGVVDADERQRHEGNGPPQFLLSAEGDDTGEPPQGPAASHLRLEQTQRSLGLRWTHDPTPRLHYTFAVYDSDFSTFGRSLDPRFGFVWTPSAASALRASVGSTFQSPQLPALIVPGTLPDPIDGYVTVGNPRLSAERSTEYDIGYEHLFGLGDRQKHLSLELYRTDLRNGIATYFPPITCPDDEPSAACLSYPVNVAREVYAGAELRGDAQIGSHTALHATYGVDSVYTKSFPQSSQDGTIVAGEQALGVPLHKASLVLEQAPSRAVDYYAGVSYEGWYNELNRPPYATLRAGATWHARSLDVGLYGTNLTETYDTKFTLAGGGVPYGGVAEPIATDAYALAGATVTLSITKRIPE